MTGILPYRAFHPASSSPRDAILDGEVIVPGGRGLSDYYKLQGDLARGRTDRFLCYTFNLLYLYGFDLRGAALIDRKQTLYNLLRILCT